MVYTQATIDAMNKRGRALLDQKKAKPPKPILASEYKPQPYTVPDASANKTGQISGLPYLYTPPTGATSSGTQTSSGFSGGGSTGKVGKEITYTVNSGITPTPDPNPTPDPTPATTPDTTQTDYYADLLAQQEEAARIRTQAARDANMANVGKVNAYSDRALQDAYISRELNRVNLPQQLSALGYSGGATETSMTGAMTDYENRRGKIEQNRTDTLDDIYENDAQILATGNAELGDLGAQYYQNLITKQARDEENARSQTRWQTEFNADQASEAYQNRLDLAKIRASYGDYSGLQELGINTNALNNGDGSTPVTRAYSARIAPASSYSAEAPTTNYYSEADRILRQRTIPSSQVALIREWNTQGKLSDTQAEALLKKYGLI